MAQLLLGLIMIAPRSLCTLSLFLYEMFLKKDFWLESPLQMITDIFSNNNHTSDPQRGSNGNESALQALTCGLHCPPLWQAVRIILPVLPMQKLRH